MVFIKNIENKMDSSISVFDIKKQSPNLFANSYRLFEEVKEKSL